MPLEQFDSSAAILGVENMDIVMLQETGQREDIAEIVVDDQDRLFSSIGSVSWSAVEHRLLIVRQFGFRPMQQQYSFFKQVSPATAHTALRLTDPIWRWRRSPRVGVRPR